MRKTWGNIYKEDHRRSPSGAASAFYPGRLVLPGFGALWTWQALLPEVRLAFHRGRPSTSASHLERAVCLSSPARSVLRRLTFPHLCRGVLCFVSFLYMMDPFKVQSFLPREGKCEILDNWKGAVRKQILYVIWTSARSLKFKYKKVQFFSVPSWKQCITEESIWYMIFSSDFSWEGPLGFEAK